MTGESALADKYQHKLFEGEPQKMATLISPGVDVQVVNESFYGSAGAGTVPLIVIATAANKTAPSGTGIAPKTTAAEANKLFLATSQRDLIQSYGNPKFYSAGGTPLHGHELNEYGLHAAYSFLGISNLAYTLRADIDLAQLEASDTAPDGAPVGGTYWFDLSTSAFGLFQSNGSASSGLAWESRTVKVTTAADIDGDHVPKTGFGSSGDFAIVPQTTANLLYEKTGSTWNAIGGSAWKTAHPTVVRGSTTPSMPANSSTMIINSSTVTFSSVTTVAGAASAVNTAAITNITASVVGGALVITNTAGGDIIISGTGIAALGFSAGTTKGVAVNYTNSPQYPAGSVSGDLWVKLSAPNRGADWKVKIYNSTSAQWVSLTAPFYAFNASVSDGTAGKDAAAVAALTSPAVGSVYVGFHAATGTLQLRRWSGTQWEAATYEASTVAPTTDPEDGTYWYNTDFRADIMVTDGLKWQAYQNRYPTTDPAGVLISGSAPTVQSDGSALVENDLWINSSDLENYPRIYRYDATAVKWKLIDLTDQTTPFGIVFADARADSGQQFTGITNDGDYAYGSEAIADMIVSDYLDPDAPDPRSYPDGVLLFNTRYSTNNVKVWRPLYFVDGGYDANTDYTLDTYTVGDGTFEFPATTAGRWVTASGNKEDGSPYMGRKAQRILVVRAMAETLASNDDIRSEAIYFNLIAAPGYPELLDEMITLNADSKEVAFVVGDTPARLVPSSIQTWAKNLNTAASNGEVGLVSADSNVGLYYPWGLGTNNDGSEIFVPPSTVALRTIAYSDQVSYPWYAPAGFQRGIVTNASSVGYLTGEGEYRSVVLNQGQRDVLQSNKINPIAFIPGRGLVLYGQKTLDPVDSAQDRINVARLVNYLRYNLDNLVKPFLFEQNDSVTRDAARLTVVRFLVGLVGLRALEDFAVQCDETNNTPERRDRSELWIDIVIKPIKAVEFIYIPLRLRNASSSIDF